ncbi:hypothetical protein ACSBR2_017114 [Camellia fascicularis]
MDRSWMLIYDRFSQPYVDGVNSFIEFAKVHLGEGREIKCPCINCCNFYKHEYDIVKAHLLISGMIVSYTTWLEHGELPEHNNLNESNGENDEDEDEYDELIEDYQRGNFMEDMRRDVQEIFKMTPHDKQVMMFSATLTKEIRPVCKKFMQDVMSHDQFYLNLEESFSINLPVGANDAELEEGIIQHLAAAAAMGRAHHHIARRDGPRSRSSVHGRPQFVVLSSHPNTPPVYLAPVGGESEPATITVASPSVPLAGGDEPQQHSHQFHSVQTDQFSSSSSGSTMIPGNRQGISIHNRQTSLPNQDRAGASDLQSFSESVKSRFNSMSMRYKETISKGTRGWRERLFSRSNTSVADIGSEVRREVNAGIASVSRLMEHLETRENSRADHASASHNLAGPSVTEQLNQNNVETRHETSRNDSSTASIAASSVSN